MILSNIQQPPLSQQSVGITWLDKVTFYGCEYVPAGANYFTADFSYYQKELTSSILSVNGFFLPQVLGLVDQLDTTRDAGDGAQVSHVTLTSAQQDQVKRISRITKILDASLLKLDDAILLFHDF